MVVILAVDLEGYKMPYYNNIPQAGDAKSASQPLILANFQYLNDLVLGKNNFILFTPEQAAAPATGALEMALYTKHVGAVPAMFINSAADGEVDFTTAHKATNGWCQLPCGLLMLWFRTTAVAVHNANTVFTYAVEVPTFPGFGAIPYFSQITPIYVAGNAPLYNNGLAQATVTIRNSSGANDMRAYVFIIGIKA